MKSRNPFLALTLVGLLMLVPPTISAQTPGAAIPFTITVSGEGTASAPAEEAMVVISLGTDQNAMYDPATGMPITPAATPEVNATPVVDAMIAHGVPVNNISIEETPFTGEWGSGSMPMPITIVATVPQPTVEFLSGLLTVVREAATAESLYVNQFGVMYSVEDCRPLRKEARVHAVANAQNEAEDQAVALDTTVGGVVSSRDIMPMSAGAWQPNNCTNSVPMKPYTSVTMVAPFDARMPAEVSVTIAVEVAFEIP